MNERFNLNLGTEQELGKAAKIESEMIADKNYTLERILANAPCYNFLLIHEIEIAGKAHTLNMPEDGACYSMMDTHAVKFDIPIRKGDKIRISAEYTGLHPAPFTKGMPFYIVVSFLCKLNPSLEESKTLESPA